MIVGIAAASALIILVGMFGVVSYTAAEQVEPSAFTAKPAKSQGSAFVLDALASAVGRPFTGIALDVIGPRRASVRRRIDAAGRPEGMTVESYARQTAGYIVIFGTVALLMLSNGNTLLAVLCVLCMFLNEAVIFSRMRARQDAIQRTLPDFLDVLAVTVSAGLNFQQAVARVSASMPGPLADEFIIALKQMEIGSSRRDAFQDLRDRNSSPIMAQFITAILQAEELGAPLSTALQDIATDMRREGAQLAKRKAQRINPRITAVTTVLSLPAVMAIVLCAMFFASGSGLGGVFG